MPGNPLDLVVEARVERQIIKFKTYSEDLKSTFDITDLGFNNVEFHVLQNLLKDPCADYKSRDGITRSVINVFETIMYRYNGTAINNFVIENLLSIVDKFYRYLLDQDLCLITAGRDVYVSYQDDENIVQDDFINYHDGLTVFIERDEAIYGYYTRREEGYFSNEEEYCYSQEADIYFVSSDVAHELDYYYCDSCQDYTTRCSCSDEEGSTFDNTYKQSKDIRLDKTGYMDYTFGVEIETCNRSSCYDSDINMKAVEDGSISGLEFVSGVLHGNRGVNMIKSICDELHTNNALVDKKCGVHIHIGGTIFNRRFSIMLAKLCYNIQDDVYKMLPASRKSNTFCKLLPEYTNEIDMYNYKKKLGELLMGSDINRRNNKKKNHPGGHYNSQRYSWVNMTNYSCTTGTNTVEFRPHSATTDFEKIYNWLLICMCIVKFAENQQRRIWTSGMSRTKLSLHEVIKYGLKEKLYKNVWQYCQNRASRFGNAL